MKPGIIPFNSRVLIGGATKIGKTFINLSFVRAVGLGGKLFDVEDFQCKQGRVLLIDKELGHRILWKRLKVYFKDLTEDELEELDKNAFYLSKDIRFNFNSSQGFDYIKSQVDKFQPNLLLLDPIGRMQHFAEQNNEGAAKFGEMLDEILYQYSSLNLSILYTHHFRKRIHNEENESSLYDPLDIQNFRGAGKLADDVDSVITVAKYKEFWEDKEGKRQKWWTVGMRFTLRDDMGMPDMMFSVNKGNDFKVLEYKEKPSREPVPLYKRPFPKVNVK